MREPTKVVTTVHRMLSADAIERKGLLIRFVSNEGDEHHVQVPIAEAHGLVDILALIAPWLPKQVQC